VSVPLTIKQSLRERPAHNETKTEWGFLSRHYFHFNPFRPEKQEPPDKRFEGS